MSKTIQVQDIVLSELTSLDGKPLDFSFKNIKNLNGIPLISSDLKYTEARQGTRKPLQINQEENQQDPKEVH